MSLSQCYPILLKLNPWCLAKTVFYLRCGKDPCISICLLSRQPPALPSFTNFRKKELRPWMRPSPEARPVPSLHHCLSWQEEMNPHLSGHCQFFKRWEKILSTSENPVPVRPRKLAIR